MRTYKALVRTTFDRNLFEFVSLPTVDKWLSQIISACLLGAYAPAPSFYLLTIYEAIILINFIINV